MRSLLLMAFAVVLIGGGLYLSLGQPRLLFQPAPLMDRGAVGQCPRPRRSAALSRAAQRPATPTVRRRSRHGAGLRQRLEQDDGSAEEWERLARSYANLQDLEGLRFALDGLLQLLQPEDPRLLMLAAQAAAEAGDRAAAGELFRHFCR